MDMAEFEQLADMLTPVKGEIRSGAGIVAGSVPEQEYRETVNEAQVLVESVRIGANRGDDTWFS